MDNLSNSNLILRTLKPKEYSQLIDDLNYNFVKILNLPGFKGIRGDSVQGVQGIGIRGSKWIFVQLQDVANEYNLTDYTQVTREWINAAFQDDPERLFSALYIPNDTNLRLGDILVLPDGSIVTMTEHVNADTSVDIVFVDTGISFAEVTSVSESRVIEIFQELYTQSNTNSGATRHYRAVAKNASDASPQLNTQVNNDSAVDIVSSDSGAGAPLSDYSFLGTSESAVTPTTQLCLLVGSAKAYHRLVGATQESFNNDFVPGVDDFAALVVLQNNNKNGILFGNKNSQNLRKFGRLYNNGSATILTSSNSPIQDQFSDVVLTDTQVIIRALNTTINTKVFDINAERMNSRYIRWSATRLYLGDGVDSSLWINFLQGVYIRNLTNADILTTDADGKLIKKFSVAKNFNSPSDETVPTTRAVSTMLGNIDLSGVGTINSELTRRIFMTRYEAPISSGSIQPNTLTSHGTYTLRKGNKITGDVLGQTNATLNNDALMTVHRWEDASVNYEYVMQRVVTKNPMFVGGATVANSDDIVYRRGRRSTLSGDNVFTYDGWVKEINDSGVRNIIEQLGYSSLVNRVTAIENQRIAENLVQLVSVMSDKITAIETANYHTQQHLNKTLTFIHKGATQPFDLIPTQERAQMMTITFPSAGTSNYQVLGTLRSRKAANQMAVDLGVTWAIRGKYPGSFEVSFREMWGDIQDIIFEYIIVPN